MIALEARALRKSFGEAEVLRGASLTLRAGEVHALAGGNGAGKSTMIKILAGVHADFEGELLLGGAPRRFADPLAARRAGMATIHQELSLVGAMSVADNLLLGREPRGRLGLVDRSALRLEARRILEAFGLELELESPVEALPIATQQLLEIAKALGGDARVLIFDEPTSALDDAEADRLLSRIDALRREGRAILFVSHRMEEIYRIADRITVLRDGVCVTTAAPAELPREALIRRMLGEETRGREKEQGGGEDGEEEQREGRGREDPLSRPVLYPSLSPLPPRPPRLPVLSLSSLSVPSLAVEGRLDVEGASFEVAPGEIVGIAGLRGAGAGELLEALYGARPTAGGRIEIDGRPASIGAPADALRLGVALLAGDRRRAGVVPALDLVQNATLASLARWSAGPWILRDRERDAVAELAALVGLRDAALDAEVGSLSGGTQQKVCLARCLLASPRVLLLDEPTRGVDVGAKADIHDLIRLLARRGAAVLFASSELTELCALAARVLVLYRGRLVADLPRADATRERILHDAMGGGRS